METIQYIVIILGIIAFTVSGSMVAVLKKVDVFGVVFLGFTTSFGGGIARDIMLGNFPPKIFNSPEIIIISLVTGLCVFFIAFIFKEKYMHRAELIDRVNNVFDALGLGVFTAIGTNMAMEKSDNFIFILFCAMITAIGGGMVRDVLINETPFVLKKHIYALASLSGSAIFYFSVNMGLSVTVSTVITTAFVFVLRILATVFKWNMPKAIK